MGCDPNALEGGARELVVDTEDRTYCSRLLVAGGVPDLRHTDTACASRSYCNKPCQTCRTGTVVLGLLTELSSITSQRLFHAVRSLEVWQWSSANAAVANTEGFAVIARIVVSYLLQLLI